MASTPNRYIAQLHLPIKTEVIYLDCGIFFPFYFKDADNINIARWLGDLCGLTASFLLRTTEAVWRETETAYSKVPIGRNQRQQVKSLYEKIEGHTDVIYTKVEPDSKGSTYSLGRADLSLLQRPEPHYTLITADKALFHKDNNSILLLWDMDAQQLSYLDGQC